MKKFLLTLLALCVITSVSYAACNCPNCNCGSNCKCDTQKTVKECSCAKCQNAKVQIKECQCPKCSKQGCDCKKCNKASKTLEKCNCPKCNCK